MRDKGPAKTVLVAGATGRLGLVVDKLLVGGHSVRAMTREIDSPAAARLRGIGARVVYGDYDDVESIAAAAAGVDAVFATGTAHQAGPEGELRHGRNVADASAAAGVRHLVYSSGDGAAPDSPVPLFRVKFAIEEHIRSLGIEHTILAPVYFMENLFNPWNLSPLRAGTFPSPIATDRPLQQAAIGDVAAFAVLAIERPAEFAAQRIGIASDELSARQAAAALARVIERPLRAERIAADQLPPGLRALFAWLEEDGHHVNTPALHRRHPDIGWQRYSDWVQSQRSRLRSLCPQSA